MFYLQRIKQELGLMVITKNIILLLYLSGQIGDVIEINGLHIALPKAPTKVYSRSKKKDDQYWGAHEISKELKRIQSIFQWHDAPIQFKNKWVDYI